MYKLKREEKSRFQIMLLVTESKKKKNVNTLAALKDIEAILIWDEL